MAEARRDEISSTQQYNFIEIISLDNFRPVPIARKTKHPRNKEGVKISQPRRGGIFNGVVPVDPVTAKRYFIVRKRRFGNLFAETNRRTNKSNGRKQGIFSPFHLQSSYLVNKRRNCNDYREALSPLLYFKGFRNERDVRFRGYLPNHPK